MKKENIFIASSSEMKLERLEIIDVMEDMSINDIWYHPVIWESMPSEMRAERKEDEYLRQLHQCEICITMFWQTLGCYTKEELLDALNEQKNSCMPQCNYILLKTTGSPSYELKAFLDEIQKEYSDIIYSFSTIIELRTIVEKLLHESNVNVSTDKMKDLNLRDLPIMIAADEELHEEKILFTELIHNLNEVLESRGIHLRRVNWTPGMCDDFHKIIDSCDICLNLYWRRLSKTADEELNTAYKATCAGKNPHHLYIFFKEPSDDITTALADFKAGFETQYGHFYCRFENSDTLNLHVVLQLETYIPSLSVSHSMVKIDGVSVANISNISFAAHNESYGQLCQDIERQKARLAKYPDDIEEQQELHLLLDKRQTMEENMLDVARQINKDSLRQMSPRMQEARRLFEAGELGAVIKILNTDYIVSDIQSSKRRIDNLTLLKEQEENLIEKSIHEFLLKVKAEKTLLDEGWIKKIRDEFNLIIEETRHYSSPISFVTLLFEAAQFSESYCPDIAAVSYYKECIDVLKRLEKNSIEEKKIYGDLLFYAGRFFSGEVYEIDYDPTEGEWMDTSKEIIHTQVVKRWRDYRKRAKNYLTESVEIFESINESGRFDEDIFLSLSCLTRYEIWENNTRGRKTSFKRLISFTRNSTLPLDYLFSALIKYAIELYINDIKKELETIIAECEIVVEELEPTQLLPNVLLDIANLFEMKGDNRKENYYCKEALAKYEQLSKEDAFFYKPFIAECYERLAVCINNRYRNDYYKVDPETFKLLDNAELIFNSLYKATDSDVYWKRAGHIKNMRFQFRLVERIDNVRSIFDTILDDLKSYFSSHITIGKHFFKVTIEECPIKNIGTWIDKTPHKDEYKLFFSWEIDDVLMRRCSIWGWEGRTKSELYNYLTSDACYVDLKETISKQLERSWDRD